MNNEKEKKWNTPKKRSTTLRATPDNYARIKQEAEIQGKNITQLTNEIIDQYFYNKENKLDNQLESYIFEQMQKIDKHLSSIAIKNARDTCTTLAAMLMLIKITSKGQLTEEDIEEKIMVIGEDFYNRHWRSKK